MPIRIDKDGVIRVGQSRVVIEVVVQEFHKGTSPEAIVEAYPALDLEDVRDAIAHYVAYREEVDTYMRARQEKADRLRQEIESRPGHAEWLAKMRNRAREYRENRLRRG